MSEHRLCPWWLGYLLASPVRRWMQDPAAILAPYVHEGMTVLEPGPGMGFFTLELGRRVGPGGRVVAVDIQPRMLAVLERRAAKAGLGERVETRLAPAGSMGIEDLAGKVDFTLAFAMVHELPSAAEFFRETSRAMKAGATLLLAEPAGHVNDAAFAAELSLAAAAGLSVTARPSIRRSLAALLEKA
jgi:ubiquinone/menaquinone biosynthesis C-methylase UbiE